MCTHLIGYESNGNEIPFAIILVTAPNLFTKNDRPIKTPFTKSYTRSDGNVFYLQFKVTKESIIKQFIPSLVTLFSHWFIVPEISGMDISLPTFSLDKTVETGKVMEKRNASINRRHKIFPST